MRRTSTLIAVSIVVVGVAAVRHDSAAAVLCKKKSGVMVVRDATCKRKEAPLNLSDFGAVAPIGPPVATAPSNAISGSLLGPVTITTATTPGDPIGHLNLPAGKYVISAKGWLENQSASITTDASCTLDAGSDMDEVLVKIEPSGGGAFRAAFALIVTHEFDQAGTAQLSCATGTGVTITANEAVVTAIEIGTLTAGGLSPG